MSEASQSGTYKISQFESDAQLFKYQFDADIKLYSALLKKQEKMNGLDAKVDHFSGIVRSDRQMALIKAGYTTEKQAKSFFRCFDAIVSESPKPWPKNDKADYEFYFRKVHKRYFEELKEAYVQESLRLAKKDI